MLTSIKSPTAGKTETAADMLLGCHERIRHFTAVSTRLAGSADATADEIAAAAESVYRYFTVALPLHEADENVSLHPRLREAAPAALAAASEEMVRQHQAIDALIGELLPIWGTLQNHPDKLPQIAPKLAEKSHRLQQLWDVHLELEEETVFPAIAQCLSPAQQEAIVSEMRARRGNDASR